MFQFRSRFDSSPIPKRLINKRFLHSLSCALVRPSGEIVRVRIITAGEIGGENLVQRLYFGLSSRLVDGAEAVRLQPGAAVKLAADLVTGATPVVDPAPFRYSRFYDGSNPQPIAGL